MDLLDALAGATDDNPEGRIYGFLLGRVTDISDPQGLGRVRARYGAMDEASSSDWIMPAWPGAIEGIPRVGDYLMVAFLDGNVHKGVYFTTSTTRSQNRPTDFIPLGLQLCGILNDFADKFDTHGHKSTTAGTNTLGPVASAADGTSPISAQRCLDGRGHKIPSISSDVKVLSSEAKVR